MATVIAPCEKCKVTYKSITSPLPPEVEIKLAWWCKGCQKLNGVVYRFLNQKETEIVRRFKPFINSPMPTVDLDVEEPKAPEDDISGLMK